MHKVLVSILLVMVTLAGCSDKAGKATADPDDVDFGEVPVEVTEDTGAIRGVVLNDAIVPVAGAFVQVLGSPLNATTDSQGRFVFSKVVPGTYFLAVSKDLHQATQTQVNVVAGAKEPPILKVQLVRDYPQDPYMAAPIEMVGFFTCTQAGGIVWGYSSSPCHMFTVPQLGPQDTCASAGVCLDQTRVFHANVGPGWQTMVFEMTWEASATGTSEKLGMTVSENYDTRSASHIFASYGSGDPVLFRLEVGEPGPLASGPSGDKQMVPPEGMQDMSMFMSVRQPDPICVATVCRAPPALAVDQEFRAWVTQFYYAPAPEGWSFMAGSPDPFKP
jgi:hypothetical protein